MADIIQEEVKVLSNMPVGPGCYRIKLSSHRQYKKAVPGQFVMIRLIAQIDPLLPRPFSIHRLTKRDGRVTGLELLYKVVGKATHALSLKKPGDFLNMTGPLGNGFSIPAGAKHIKIVAGRNRGRPDDFFSGLSEGAQT